MLKILHLAPQNYAGVPYSFYDMHNKCGDYSRLITFHKNPLVFPEDICLNLPLPNSDFAKKWRKRKMVERESHTHTSTPIFKPKNIAENFFFRANDILKKKKINEVIRNYNLDNFDIIHFDAGLDFFRNASQAKKWKSMGKKIVCCYFGSDLRIRGIIKELNDISDLNITSEFDHLAMKKDLFYIFYPYDPSELPPRNNENNERVKIIHSPTNRKYKGTELIVSVIQRIKKEKDIEFLLMENVDRNELLKIKSGCDIAIDQVGGSMGGTGYGKAGLETLGMEIPTITNMTEEYKNWLPENPFVVANNAEELYLKLNELIEDKNFRLETGRLGKIWLQKYHGYEAVNNKLKELYKLKKIIT